MANPVWNAAELMIAVAELLQEVRRPRREAVEWLKQNIRDKAKEANKHVDMVALAHLQGLLNEMNARLKASKVLN